VINLDELFNVEIRTYIKLNKERVLKVEDIKRHKKLGSFIQDLVNNYFDGNRVSNSDLQQLISRLNQLEAKIDNSYSRKDVEESAEVVAKNETDSPSEVDLDLASLFNIS